MPNLEVLNTAHGDKKLYFNDSEVEQRCELAEKILELRKFGCALFLTQGHESKQIDGYDKESNEWILFADTQAKKRRRKQQTTRVSAKDTTILVVAPMSGG